MTTRAMRYAALAGVVYFGSIVSAAALSPQDFTGSVGLVGNSSCPRGTLEAKGQLLQVSEYSQLFQLFKTTYGGDGTSTFGLPDLSTQALPKGMRYCVVVQGLYPPPG